VIVPAIVVIVVVAFAAAVMYSFFNRDEQDTITDAVSADRADEARELIADLERGDDAVGEGETADYERTYEQAEEFQREARLADAQLLYFYAARGGHAPSAFALAAMNDPNHHSEQTSLLSEPDPFQAYKWYSVALEHGAGSAAARLEELHEWAKQAAANGDVEAERLLLQWE
jgi:TPR repeat protein